MLKHPSIAKAIRVYEADDNEFDSNEIAKQYCQFMVLKIKNSDFSASNSKLSPGGAIDAFWHCHILDTEGYSAFFNNILPSGIMVHHDPEKSNTFEIYTRQMKTYQVYQAIFNKSCPFFRWHSGYQPPPEVDIIGTPINVTIKPLGSKLFSIEVGIDNTIEQLKYLIHDCEGCFCPDKQILIYAGNRLKPDRTLRDYNINDEDSVYLNLCLGGC